MRHHQPVVMCIVFNAYEFVDNTTEAITPMVVEQLLGNE